MRVSFVSMGGVEIARVRNKSNDRDANENKTGSCEC